MAGHGPAPKDPSVRARRNKAATHSTLRADAAIVAPELPEGDWHPMVLEWWRDLWSSPMAPEYADADRHGLFVLAMLHEDFWRADSASGRKELAAEIRQQERRYGLSPMDRRSLQWEIERTEAAVAQGERRRTAAQPSRPHGDPRSVLHLA